MDHLGLLLAFLVGCERPVARVCTTCPQEHVAGEWYEVRLPPLLPFRAVSLN